MREREESEERESRRRGEKDSEGWREKQSRASGRQVASLDGQIRSDSSGSFESQIVHPFADSVNSDFC